MNDIYKYKHKHDDRQMLNNTNITHFEWLIDEHDCTVYNVHNDHDDRIKS